MKFCATPTNSASGLDELWSYLSSVSGEYSGGSRNFENGMAEDTVSAPSSFIANAHNELYTF